MPIEPLTDAMVLNNLFSQALSPINTYSEGLLKLAMARKMREQQLSDVASSRQFETEKAKQRQAFEIQQQQQEQAVRERLASSAQGAMMDRLKEEYALRGKERQEISMENLRRDAAEAGIPSPKGDVGDERDYYIQAISSKNSQDLASALVNVGKLQQQFSQATQISPQELSRRQADTFLGSLGNFPALQSAITPAEAEQIRFNPEALQSLGARLARDTSTNGKKLYFNFLQASQEAAEKADQELVAQKNSRADVVALAQNLGAARNVFVEIMKRASPSAQVAGLQAMVDQSKRQETPGPPAPIGPPRPTLPRAAVGATMGSAQQPSPLEQAFREARSRVALTGQALRAPLSNLAGRIFGGPVMDPSLFLNQEDLANIPMSSAGVQADTDLRRAALIDMARRKMNQVNAQQATNQSIVSPNAFPAYPSGYNFVSPP